KSAAALTGGILAVLGIRGDPRFEILASAYAEGFSDEFDPATALAAQSVPDHVHPEEIAARRDLRHLALVTIDGEDARDFDDAVHVSRTASGYRLVVAIADVPHYVRPGAPLDHAGLTYAGVAEALAGAPDPEWRPLLDDLRTAHELSKKLTEQRKQRGSIDFDLPEAKIVLDDEGKVAEIVRRPRNDAHRLVEEFMLAANEGVARFFDVRGLPTVYRIHDQPDQEK